MQTHPMRVFVSGADGCVGRAICRQLRTAGHEVVAQVFARAPASRDEYRIDLLDAVDDRALPDGPYDALVHCAGNVDPRVSTRRMFAINAEGTRRMLRWARGVEVGHFVQISSISVYGPRATGGPRPEERTPRSRLGLAYARSKRAAEIAVEQAGLDYSILRLPMVLGVGDAFATPTICTAMHGGRFFMPGQGRATVSVMTVPNIGPLLQALLAAGPLQAALNAADFHLPWRQICQAYADGLGLPLEVRSWNWPRELFGSEASRWLFIYAMGRGAHFPTDRLQAHLGHFPREPWRETILAAARDWAAHHLL